MAQEENNPIFLTVPQFKAERGVNNLEFHHNSEKGTRFASSNKAGDVYKVQKDIDYTRNISFMYFEDEGIANGCFINGSESVVTEFSI